MLDFQMSRQWQKFRLKLYRFLERLFSELSWRFELRADGLDNEFRGVLGAALMAAKVVGEIPVIMGERQIRPEFPIHYEDFEYEDSETKADHPLPSITDQRVQCGCSWSGTVLECDANEADDSDGELLCPSCGSEVETFAPAVFSDIAFLLKQAAIPMTLRYDPMRSEDNFTIIGQDGWVCNTNEPMEVMRKYLVEILSRQASEKKDDYNDHNED